MDELGNDRGLTLRVLPYGGIIQSLRVPDRDGVAGDVVLGFDSPERYRGEHPYFGALIGRHAGRIAGGRFVLDGREYRLAVNNGPNHLHGGLRGFDRVPWDVERVRGNGHRDALALHYTSPSGEEGYPGRLRVTVTYTVTERSELVFDYHATSDAPTPVNLTQHSYFNLSGHGAGPVLDHEVTILADAFLPVDESRIPTGEVRSVEGTPLDFRSTRRIGDRIDRPDPQLRRCRGYDHYYVLGSRRAVETPRLAARVRDPASGRTLELRTTEPGLAFYTGNYLDGSVIGKGGVAYGRRSGFCLEPQNHTDAPNHSRFPSPFLRPGEEYRSRTILRFSAD